MSSAELAKSVVKVKMRKPVLLVHPPNDIADIVV